VAAFLDVRRLAAVDMHGLSGSPRRAHIILLEFYAGVIGCVGLGVLSAVSGSGLARVLGIWLITVGINYIPLAIDASSLSRPGALETELDGLDIRSEARRVGVRQLWILVPFAVVAATLL